MPNFCIPEDHQYKVTTIKDLGQFLSPTKTYTISKMMISKRKEKCTKKDYSHVSNKRWHRLFIIGNCSTQIPLIIVQKNSPFIKFEKKNCCQTIIQTSPFIEFQDFSTFSHTKLTIYWIFSMYWLTCYYLLTLVYTA